MKTFIIATLAAFFLTACAGMKPEPYDAEKVRIEFLTTQYEGSNE
jgi:PBP1b-binding outer membrane lipoprotein LpoB